MAALIDLTEGAVDVNDRQPTLDVARDWLRLDQGHEISTVAASISAAWERVEARIPNRYAPRSFTAIIRADLEGELYQLPLTPVTVAEVELFDADNGLYVAQTALKAGPLPGSFYLPSAGVWRLTGTAGPVTVTAAPSGIEQAVLRLVTYAFERRGDFDDHRGFHDSGAADLLRQYVRL